MSYVSKKAYKIFRKIFLLFKKIVIFVAFNRDFLKWFYGLLLLKNQKLIFRSLEKNSDLLFILEIQIPTKITP